MFTSLPHASPARPGTGRPGAGHHPPPSRGSVPVSMPSSIAPPAQHRKKRSCACTRDMCSSLLALPWITFMLCGIIIAATIAWQNYFLDAAKKTGQVLALVQSKTNSYPYSLWRPHRKLVIGTAISVEVITLFVVLAAVLRMMQGALRAGRIRRGPTHHVWSSVYLALSGGCAILMWFVMWWMVMMLGVSVAWQFGSVTTRNAATSAVAQQRAFSLTNTVNLAAPNAAQALRRQYNRALRPVLTPKDQGLVDQFFNENMASVTDASMCPSTCLDARLLKGALGSSACVCDAKKLQDIGDLSSSIAKVVISMMSCLICNGIAASLLVINLVARFVVAKADYIAGGSGRKSVMRKSVDDDAEEEEYEEEEGDEEVGFVKGEHSDSDQGHEKVLNWNARQPSEQSIPAAYQNVQARQMAAQQAQQQAQHAQQQAQQVQQLRQMEMLRQMEARKQQQQHYSYAQQLAQQRPREDSYAGSDQQSVQSAWKMVRPEK